MKLRSIFINPNEKLYKNADKIKPIKGYGDNVIHGQPIRLISCQTGAKENGIAQQIADELGVVILAPTEIVNVDMNGEMFLSDNGDLAEIWNISTEEERKHIAQTGRWRKFKPNKR